MWTLWRAAQEKKNHRFRFNRTLQLQNRREGLYSLHTVCVVRGWYTVVAGSLTLFSGSASLLAPLRCESLCFILEVTCFALFKAPLLLLSVDLKKTEKKKTKDLFSDTFMIFTYRALECFPCSYYFKRVATVTNRFFTSVFILSSTFKPAKNKSPFSPSLSSVWLLIRGRRHLLACTV